MYGDIITKLPGDFVPYQQWPEYNLAGMPLTPFNPHIIGAHPRGVRWGFWPFTFEDYVSEDEPDLSLSDPHRTARNRIILWHRLARTDVPSGWYCLARHPARLEGYTEVTEKPYTTRWDESARRYRSKWLRKYANTTHSIVSVSYDDFKAAYLHSTVAKKIKHLMLDLIERQMTDEFKSHYEFIAVRDLTKGELVAGMALLHSPTYTASYYVSGFWRADAGDVPVMIALMDHWHHTCQQRGLKYLHFGEFWIPGKPKNWKGFSIFKAKFGLYYVQYPPPLVRFGRGKLY